MSTYLEQVLWPLRLRDGGLCCGKCGSVLIAADTVPDFNVTDILMAIDFHTCAN